MLSKRQLKLNVSFLNLYLFVFLAPIALIAQIEFKDSELSNEIFESGQVAVAKDQQDNGYLITKKGYYDLTKYEFHPFKIKIDSLFGKINNIHQFNITAVGEKIYFINPSGGYVFEFNKNTIARIDNSFNQRAYFNSRVFTYNGQIYLLGGYGYWEFKSHLLRYDFDLREWLLEEKLLEDNFGFDQTPFITLYNDKLYILSFFLIDNFRSLTLKNDKFFIYDFKSKSKMTDTFEYEKFDIFLRENREVLFDSSISDNENILIYTNYPSSGFLIFNFNTKTVAFKKIKSSGFQSSTTPIKINNSIYTLINDKSGQNKTRLIKVELENAQQKIDSFNSNTIMYLVIIFLITALVVSTFIFFKTKSTFKLFEKKLVKGLTSMKINYEEYYFFNYLIENGSIENQVLINYFDRDKKSYDLNVKRKNAMIEKLENKIQSTFKTKLFKKTLSPKDRRQGIYILVKKLKKG